ncbi:MAG: hypothetical protein J0L92_08270 [Deltaproteobacteria bacterium]|nr:hypothetical protein [Deltaproteobacteria bacterium]
MPPLQISKERVWARAIAFFVAFLVLLAIPSVAWFHELYLGQTLACATLVPRDDLAAAIGVPIASTRSDEDPNGCRTYFDDRDARELASVAIGTRQTCDPLAAGGVLVDEVRAPARASVRGGTYLVVLEVPGGCVEARIGNGVARVDRDRVVTIASGMVVSANDASEYLATRSN